MSELERTKRVGFGLFFLFLPVLFFPRFLSPVEAGNYGCPYNYCEGCWCVNGVCASPQGCPDECSESFGVGPGYCCPPTPTPTPRPPRKACNESCGSNSQCSKGLYCSSAAGNKCRNRNCPQETDCICPATPTPTLTPTPTPRKACDEPCSNNGECSTNYCYSNRCRNRDCPEETDCICPPKACNESCKSGWECATGYCYSKDWCRNQSCPEEEDCECPETKMCQFKGCESVNGRCVWKEFGPIPWEAPCPEDDCQNNNDCRNIKFCTWNECACPDNYCYSFEGFAVDLDKDCPVGDPCEPYTYDDPVCVGACPGDIALTKSGPNTADPGEEVTYDFGVSNTSSTAGLTNVQVTDPLLGGILWGPQDLAAGGNVSFNVNYIIPGGASGAVVNTATVTGIDPDGDEVTDEETWTISVNLPPGVDGWFQTDGGDVHSNYIGLDKSVFSDIPSTADNPYFSAELGDNTPGVVSGSNTDMSFGAGLVSTKGWRIDSYSGDLHTGTPLPRYDYHYFHDTLRLGEAALDCPGEPGSGIFKCPSGLDVGGWDLGAGERMIVFIEGGDLNITAEMNVAVGGFLAFIVQGDVNIDPSIGGDIDESDGIDEDEVFIDGVFIADGQIRTGESDVRLVASGIFVSYGGFDLQRDLEDENETFPAELFLYRPDFVINAPEELKKSDIIWRGEVAP